MNTVNGETDEDIFFTEELNEHSQLHDDLENFATTLIDNLGVNNAVAVRAYNNIVNALRTRTKLTNEQITEFLREFLPSIGEQSIIQFMEEMDKLREEVVYSPVAEILKDF